MKVNVGVEILALHFWH